LLRLRLSAQRIEAPGVPALTIEDVARHLFAVQAQDFIQGGWALGLRARGAGLRDVQSALASGSVIRSAPFRGTLHFVAADELAWVLGVTAPRTIAGATTRLRALDLDDGTLARATDAARDALAGRNAQTREEFFAVLRRAGIDPAGQRGYNVIWYLSQTAVVCWGPPKGTQQGLVLLDEWMPNPRRLSGDDALRELALRYFTGHGPATVRDFAWWTKLTLRAARTGLDLARSELTELEHRGDSYWAATSELDLAAGGRRGSAVHALPGFDEYLLGYQDRSAALATEHAPRIVPGNNGIFLPLIVARGEIVGTWRRAEKSDGVTVTPDAFGELTARQLSSFARAAEAFARFRSN
jgi:hypothetical protein